MYFDRGVLTDPKRNTVYCILAVAISVFAFAYSYLLGQALVLIFYAVWLPLIALDPARVLRGVTRLWWIAPFSTFALLSTVWSDSPAASGRGAVQYLSCVVCAVIAGRLVRPSDFASGAALGATIVIAYSFAFGRFSYDALDGSYTFVGAFGSKNQLGFFASLGVLFCLLRLLVTSATWRTTLVLILMGTLNLLALVASQSVTSMIVLIAVAAIMPALRLMTALSVVGRFAFCTTLALMVPFAVAVALNLELPTHIFGAFGKDATLTGRTYLWLEGLRLGSEAPLLGVGYVAWWVQGFAEAERLWSEFYIASRGGFHFHNTYIQVFVDLGATGLLILVSMLLAAFFVALRGLLFNNQTEIIMHTAVLALLLGRSFVEIDMIYPYTIGAFLFYVTATRLTLEVRPSYRSMSPFATAVRARAGKG